MTESLCNWILFVLNRANELRKSINKVKLQKILFLIKNELGLDIPANFKPYKFGPYSVDIDKALNKLEKEKLVEIELLPNSSKKDNIDSDYKYVIKPLKDSKITMKGDDLNYIDRLIRMSTEDLLAYVYIKFPQYTRRYIYLKKIY
ncbi:hypothetical protein [Acidianus sp. HS-5]|uniref:hypothetical protein n=1 Tax=Acidianus sp. HS-5 TaxID=2886040 RepID=UPI001F2F18E8|nr:hypothetical protein [Acidianus sp. HS-5]BDC17359.1 hypothetical protein HS5_02490 [Acidianus sp. HS-5]